MHYRMNDAQYALTINGRRLDPSSLSAADIFAVRQRAHTLRATETAGLFRGLIELVSPRRDPMSRLGAEGG